MSDIQQGVRLRIARFLPRALENALASYKQIAAKTYKEAADAKKQHDACKVAIAHVELLLKLAKWAELPQNGADEQIDHDVLKSLIETAQAELNESLT